MSSVDPSIRNQPSLARLEQILGGLFLFAGWPAEEIRDLARLAVIRRFQRNHFVFHHGEDCVHLYVVLHGRVQLTRLTAEGREVVLNVVGPGELLACAALFLDHAFPATAQVISTEAMLLLIDGREFLDKLRRHPRLSFRMIGALAMRIAKLAARIESRLSESARQRLSAWLLQQCASAGTDRIVLGSTKKALAEELGMTPETLSRTLTGLRDAGAIRTHGKEIEVLSAAMLREIQASDG